MRVSPSYAVFTVTFAAVFSLVYVLAVEKNWALFSYAPATGTFAPLTTPAAAGPTMYWYGWIATAAIVAGAVAAVASLLPERLAKFVWPGFAWAVPVAVLIAFGYLLSGYFLR
ncbi:MAG: hypothetical protein JO328_16720 [Hyphomicrobiales bacterium]|nr:hypothetical protein [Hyphomicrobiales bacterium]MBV8824906.1 hypothetical protein [Hyphomicrobiales bacterium]MBV9428341.1 hypothetical protein [Bradyrhizobiaceae bacterium]